MSFSKAECHFSKSVAATAIDIQQFALSHSTAILIKVASVSRIRLNSAAMWGILMMNLSLDHHTIDGWLRLWRIDGVTDYVTTLRLFVRLGWLVTQPSVYGA